MNSKYRYLVPNGITFISLICGSVSLMSAASGYFLMGGSLVLASYILDLFDGALARRLNASSCRVSAAARMPAPRIDSMDSRVP